LLFFFSFSLNLNYLLFHSSHLHETLWHLIQDSEDSIFYKVEWCRVFLDEAHTIKSWMRMGAQSAFALPSNCHWCLTGTPLKVCLLVLWCAFLSKIDGIQDPRRNMVNISYCILAISCWHYFFSKVRLVCSLKIDKRMPIVTLFMNKWILFVINCCRITWKTCTAVYASCMWKITPLSWLL
jgi:hypothetical protein